jgi:hypothetical protein
MIFFSKKGAFRQVLTKSTYAYHKMGDTDEKVPVFGVTAEFTPIPGQGIMLKGKMWKGKLDTEHAAAMLRRSDKDITESELALALLNHRNYGSDFIAFGEDGEAVEDEALVIAAGDGSYACQCCDQVIKNKQGLQGHFGSEKHASNRAKYIADLKKQFRI